MRGVMQLGRYLHYIRFELKSFFAVVVLYLALSLGVIFTPGLSKLLYDKLFITYDAHLLLKYLGIALFLFFYELILSFFFSFVETILSVGLENKFKYLFTRKMMHAKYSYTLQHDTGFIMKRLTDDTEAMAEGIQNLTMALCCLVKIVGIGFILYFIDVWLLKLYCTLIAATVTWTVVFTIPCVWTADKIGADYSDLFTFFWEVIPGIKTVKLLNYYSFVLKKMEAIQKRLRMSLMLNSLANSVLWQISHIFPYVGYVAILIVGLQRIESGQFTVGALFGLFSMMWIIYEPLQELFSNIGNIQHAISAAKRTIVIDKAPKEEDGSALVESFNKAIEFKDVTFSYDGKTNVLDNFNLKISKGENIAFVGESGSGKTTIIHLLIKLFDSYEGEILVDGADLRSLNTKSLRKNISFVSQDSYLFFGGTLRENIDFSGRLSEDELHTIIDQVNLTAKFQKMPNGLQTIVGEDGLGFSGGEKQRLCIARSLASEADIIVLDEISSALDPQNEAQIVGELFEMVKDKTVISISHRESYLKFCHSVYNLHEAKQGPVVAQ